MRVKLAVQTLSEKVTSEMSNSCGGFQAQLGDLAQMPFITTPGKNGIAGVSGGKLIHFAPLWSI
jgi:hypothetical protein